MKLHVGTKFTQSVNPSPASPARGGRLRIAFFVGCVLALLLGIGRAEAVIVASDDFSSGGYSGGTGWTGAWVDSQDGSSGAGLIRVVTGQLRFQGVSGTDPTIRRTVDLSSATSATLSFALTSAGDMEANDEFQVCWASTAAGPFTNCQSFFDTQNTTVDVDLTGVLSATTTIRFGIAANVLGSDEFYFVDDVEIDAEIPAPPTNLTDDFAVADYGEPAIVNVTDNDNTVVAGTVCIEDQGTPGTCDPDSALIVPGEGVWVELNDVIQFTPEDGFSGAPDPINYLADVGGGVFESAEFRVIINERSLCTADGTIQPYVMANPSGTNNLVVFQVQDAQNPGDITNTGPSYLELDHNAQAAIQNGDADPDNNVGTVNQINSLGLDTARNYVFYHDNAQAVNSSNTVGGRQRLYMWDADLEQIHELIGPNAPAGYPSSYASVVPAPQVICGTEMGSAAGEYFGGSYYFGLEEESGCDSDGFTYDTLYKLDFDFSVYPPEPIVPATLIWTFDPANAGNQGAGTAHDWGDILVTPEDADGMPGTGDERLVLIDFDRNNGSTADHITRLDITDPDNVQFLSFAATSGNSVIGQAAISYDGTSYVFLSGDNAIAIVDPETGVLQTGSTREINTANWPDGAEAVDGSSCVDPIGSLPVTLGHFHSRQAGSRLRINWQTLTETFTIGFNIWAQVNENWVQLNRNLVRTKRLDSVVPQRYATSVSTRDLDGEITAVALTSVDLNGHEEGYGPFEVGERYGEESEFQPVPWNDIRQANDARMEKKGYVWKNNRWRKLSKGIERRMARDAANAETLADISVAETGMVRLTYNDLLNEGIDMDGVLERDIALTWKGMPVPIKVEGRGNRFRPGSEIHFYAEAPKGEDALYIDENVYQLAIDGTRALQVRTINRGPRGVVESYLASSVVEEDIGYAMLLPTGDPFYMGVIVHGGDGGLFPAAGQPALTFDVEADVDSSKPAWIEINLAALSEYPAQDLNPPFGETDPDHAISVLVNGQAVELDNDTHRGYGRWLVTGTIPAGVLTPGINELRIRTLPTGYTRYSQKALDSYAVHYTRAAVADDDALEIGAVNQSLGDGADAGGFEVAGFSSRNLVAYAHSPSSDGHPGILVSLIVRPKRDGGHYTARFPTVGDDTTGYWVSTPDKLGSVASVSPVEPGHDLLSRQGDYILLVHPAFLPDNDPGHPLNVYIAAKEAEGYNPVVIDIDQVFADYGYGMRIPDAITAYLKAANDAFAYGHVLLVGGDVYDYLDKENTGAHSFIPTRYADTGTRLKYTPTDALLVDFDGDEISDKPLGRWPVRTHEDLEIIVNKTLAFSNLSTGLYNQRRALLIAEEITAQEGYDFDAQMDRLSAVLQSFPNGPADPVRWADTPDAVDRVSIQDIHDDSSISNKLAEAQRQIEDGINAADGQTLTIFGGHGSPTTWSFNGVLKTRYGGNTGLGDRLDNAGRPTLMMPMACYTTYYNETHTDSLAHQLLLGGDYGAVAIHAAATLSGYGHNEAMGRTILRRQLRQGDTLGEAVERARQTSRDRDVRINWTVLGDPTLRIE